MTFHLVAGHSFLIEKIVTLFTKKNGELDINPNRGETMKMKVKIVMSLEALPSRSS
jgi:hypothetical protein